jgi:hypothetical protein
MFRSERTETCRSPQRDILNVSCSILYFNRVHWLAKGIWICVEVLSLFRVFLRNPLHGFSSSLSRAAITVTQKNNSVSHSCFVTAFSLKLLFIDLKGHRRVDSSNFFDFKMIEFPSMFLSVLSISLCLHSLMTHYRLQKLILMSVAWYVFLYSSWL